jgi:hypothetical protein
MENSHQILSCDAAHQELEPPFTGHEFLDGVIGEDGAAVLGGGNDGGWG